MLNSITLATKFQPLLDEVYKANSLTADLESNEVIFDGSQTVKVLKLEVPALGAYSRNSGYTSGDVTANWEAFTLTQDRGTEFSVDAMDDEETLNMTFGKSSSEFIRLSVVPQVDAYRFAKMAQSAGIGGKSAALSTAQNVIDAIAAAMTEMDEDEVTPDGRILYITPTCKGLIDSLDLTKSKAVMDRFAKIVIVPKGRFMSNITITNSGYAKNTTGTTKSFTGDGSKKTFTLTDKPAYLDSVTVDSAAKTEGTDFTYDSATGIITFGTAPADTKAVVATYGVGKDVNFMIVEPSAAFAVAKHTKLRAFDPDTNQDADAWKFQYRIYHDAFVYENKASGIYVHNSTT